MKKNEKKFTKLKGMKDVGLQGKEFGDFADIRASDPILLKKLTSKNQINRKMTKTRR